MMDFENQRLSQLINRLSPNVNNKPGMEINKPLNCSIVDGSAGIAYAFYRLFSILGDGKLLKLAFDWLRLAEQNLDGSAGNIINTIESTQHDSNLISPYYAKSGLFFTQTLIYDIVDEVEKRDIAIMNFLTASSSVTDDISLLMGISGTLLMCSILLRSFREKHLKAIAQIYSLGNSIVHRIWIMIKSNPEISDNKKITNWGMAHGWSGILYPLVRWYIETKTSYPGNLKEILLHLANSCAITSIDSNKISSIYDTNKSGSNNFSTSWCNGSAGLVYLWTSAYELYKEDDWKILAKKAATYTWEGLGVQTNTLCCGFCGRAYSMLNYFRFTSDSLWLFRAEVLSDFASSTRWITSSRMGLYKGNSGVAVLLADITVPEYSAMPFFEH